MSGAKHRILHLVTDTDRRGAQLFAQRLAYQLEERGFINHVQALYPGHNGAVATPSAESPVKALAGPRSSAERFLRIGYRRTLALRRCIQDLAPDVLIAHGATTLQYAALAKLMHNSVTTIYKNIGMASYWADSPGKVALGRLSLRGIDLVVSVSEATRADFMETYHVPSERVAHIPNGVDAANYEPVSLQAARPAVRSELGLSPQDQALVSVGSLSAEKGISELLRMVKALATDGLLVHLLLAGDGPLREALEAQATDLRIPDRVHFMGSRSDVECVLAAADLFVLPSRTEGMPGVLIEAGMAGLPSVAYDVGAVSEVIEDGTTGYVVPPGHTAAFTDRVTALLEGAELRQRMGSAARQRCVQRFDMRVVTDQYATLFRELVEEKRAVEVHG